MRKLLLRGVLPVLAAGVVLSLLLVCACAIVLAELALAVEPKYVDYDAALNIAFVAFLFIMATGIPADWAMKRLGVRNLFLFLASGAVSGALAEHCYLVESDIQDSWDFTMPRFAAILSEAIGNLPSSLVWIERMLPESAIPVGVGLIGSGLYWLVFARKTIRPAATAPVPEQPPIFVAPS